MLSHYQVTYEGRTYYGNVALREHHLFSRGDSRYLLIVDDMAVHNIGPRTQAAIRLASSSFGGLIPGAAMEELRRYALVSGEEPVKTASEPATDDKPARTTPELPVVNIALFLAQACNLRCVYCYGEAGEYAGPGLMSRETGFSAVDWLMANSKSSPAVNIGFFGGEPLLNFELLREIVPYARKLAALRGKRIGFSITTNGTLLTDEIIAFLASESISVVISFDGPAEIQNRQRPFKDGTGTYELILANVARLRQAAPSLLARATLCGATDPFVVRDSLERDGFAASVISPASPVLLCGADASQSPVEDGRMLAFWESEIERTLPFIRERRFAGAALPVMLPTLAEFGNGHKRRYGCGVGKGMAAITVNGDIYPCHRFAGMATMRMGNIADYKAGELNGYYRALVDNRPKCRGCFARYYCGGGCAYQNLGRTGDASVQHDGQCLEQKTMFEALLSIYCELTEDDKAYLKEMLDELAPVTAQTQTDDMGELQ